MSGHWENCVGNTVGGGNALRFGVEEQKVWTTGAKMYSELLAWFNLRKGPQKKSKPTIITTELIVPFCNLYLHFVEDWLSLIAGALLIYLLDHHHAWGTGCLSTIFFFFRLRFTFKVVYIIPYFLFYILFLPFFFAWIKWGP